MKVELKKPKSGGLGIGLVTAEKNNQTGVFVRTIMEDSVAHADGRLKIMDRIVQVRMSYHDATNSILNCILHYVKGTTVEPHLSGHLFGNQSQFLNRK